MTTADRLYLFSTLLHHSPEEVNLIHQAATELREMAALLVLASAELLNRESYPDNDVGDAFEHIAKLAAAANLSSMDYWR